MEGPDHQLGEHLEGSRQHEQEVDRLLRGIKAWCAATPEGNNSSKEEDREARPKNLELR
jgi:hypothetical protein